MRRVLLAIALLSSAAAHAQTSAATAPAAPGPPSAGAVPGARAPTVTTVSGAQAPSAASASGAPAPGGDSTPAGRLTTYVGKINLNQASLEQLEMLPGIGKKAAEKIVAYRAKRRFGRIQELVRVKGFGRKKFLKLQPHLAVEGENTFRIESISHDGRHVVTRTARPRE